MSGGYSKPLTAINPNVVNVVVAKNFNYVNHYIQLQALEVRYLPYTCDVLLTTT